MKGAKGLFLSTCSYLSIEELVLKVALLDKKRREWIEENGQKALIREDSSDRRMLSIKAIQDAGLASTTALSCADAIRIPSDTPIWLAKKA